MIDWRKDYTICEHTAEDQEKGTRHSGFRVCCDECMEKGFLSDDELDIKEEGELTIGKQKEVK